MTIKEIYDYIDSFAPFDSQCEWDNSGILLGSAESKLKKIGFSLDITGETVKNAVLNECNLIITHHPVIFHPVTSIGFEGLLYDLIKNNIAVISAHTNLDKSEYGVNYILADKLGLHNARQFESETDASMCFIGEVNNINASEFAEIISKALNSKIEFTCPDKIINRVAVCGGAGGEFMYETSAYIDAFVTGEVKHHEFIDSSLKNISIYRAGHFETEYPVIPYLCNKIKNETGADCILLEQSNPCCFYGDK